MTSRRTGRRIWRKLKAMLIVLFLSFVLMVSGCVSNSQTPKCAQSRVTVDQTLMAEPSYQTELLRFLSDRPSEPTSK